MHTKNSYRVNLEKGWLDGVGLLLGKPYKGQTETRTHDGCRFTNEKQMLCNRRMIVITRAILPQEYEKILQEKSPESQPVAFF